jgi:hypothetical protein
MAVENLNLNEQILRSLYVAKESGVPVCFLSNPGFGKTTMIQKYAEENGMNLVILRGSDYEPEDILGFNANENGELKRLLPAWYKQLRNDKPNLLFIDELTTASDHTQSPLLSVIFDKKVGDYPLPEDTFIVAAGNYSLNLTDNFNLISPIVNRFMFINLKATNEDIDLFLGLEEKYVPFSAKKIKKITYTDEDKKNTRIALSNLIKDMNINLNETDLKDIYMNQEYVMNAPTPRALHYLGRVSDVLIENNLVHPKFTEIIGDGLFGYGSKDFGKNYYKTLKQVAPSKSIKKEEFLDVANLKMEDFIDPSSGELKELALNITPKQLERCDENEIKKVITSILINRNTKALNNEKCRYTDKQLKNWKQIVLKYRPDETNVYEKLIGKANFDGTLINE